LHFFIGATLPLRGVGVWRAWKRPACRDFLVLSCSSSSSRSLFGKIETQQDELPEDSRVMLVAPIKTQLRQTTSITNGNVLRKYDYYSV